MNVYDNIFKFKGSWRSYQERVLKHADTYLQDGKIHIVAAPGSGKTTLGIELIRRLGCPALILSAQACYPGTVAGTYSGGVFDRRCETRKYSVK